MMFAKITDLAIEETAAWYNTGKTLMDYVEKQFQAVIRLAPWLTDTVHPCDDGKDPIRSLMATLGMVPHSDHRALQKEASNLAQRIEALTAEVSSQRCISEEHRKTVAEQSVRLDGLKQLNDADKDRIAALSRTLAERTACIADQKKKITEATKALEESRNRLAARDKTLSETVKALEECRTAFSLKEEELKKHEQTSAQMEKEIAELKSHITDLRKSPA
ncbi:hypothetical protein [Desulfococcus multivorans]|nr:hypothetical protein [Desulfococcus multivorans]